MKRKDKIILIGLSMVVFLTILAVVVAISVVESDVPSKANNDGWLGFLGGLFGGFISSSVAFFILYVDRKDMENSAEKQNRIHEMDKMEDDLMRAFALVGSGLGEYVYFLMIQKKIGEDYKDTDFFHRLEEIHLYYSKRRYSEVKLFEAKTCEAFLEYRKTYIEKG